MADKTIQAVKNYSMLNRRLADIMKLRSISIQVLAKKAKVAVGTIQKLMTDPSCNPTISSIEAICNVLDISISDLIGQENKLDMLNSSNVYLLNWEELPISLNNIQKLTENGQKTREVIKTSCNINKNAFALKMDDTSMLPLFPMNAVLIFDPEKKPSNNSYVLVQLRDHKKVLFKQLLINEPFKYITSINPLFKDDLIKLEKTDKIIAVLIQSLMHY